MATLRFRGSRDEFMAAASQLPAILTGRAPDPGGASKALMIAMGTVLLSRIKEAYVVKSRGGTDEMGIQWPPLAASTLERRTKGPGLSESRLQEKLAKLTPERRRLVKEHALRLATAAGAPATKNTLAVAFAEILRDMGRMLNSLGPEIVTDTVLQTGPGWLEVGSNVDYFKYHNSDKPRKLKADGTPKLPRRQVLPDNVAQIPKRWIEEMGRAARETIATVDFWRLLLGAKVA